MSKKPITVILLEDAKEPITLYLRKQTIFLSCILAFLVFGILSYFSIQFFLKPGAPKIIEVRVPDITTTENTDEVIPDIDEDSQKRLKEQIDDSPFKDLIETKAVETPSPVQIDQFSIVYFWEENSLNISFRLNNVMGEKGPVQGYVIVAAVGATSESEIIGCYPQESISRDGEIEYLKGDPFNIRRFKFIKAVFHNEDVIHTIRFIFVFAYAETGELLLKKRYRVTRGQ